VISDLMQDYYLLLFIDAKTIYHGLRYLGLWALGTL
jgi:hypothetical protein